MTLKEFITSIIEEIDTMEEYEDKTQLLACCQNRELETLRYVLESLEQIKSIE